MYTQQQIKELAQKIKSERRKKLEQPVLEALAAYCKDDLQLYDVTRIEKRAKQIWEQNILPKLNFENKEITDKIKDLIKALIGQAREAIPAPKTQAEFIEAEKNKALTLTPGGEKPKINANDPTVQSCVRCEPHVISILEKVIDHNLLSGEDEFLDGAIKESIETVFRSLVDGYLWVLFDVLDFSTNESKMRVDEMLYDGRPVDKISFGQIDVILKKNAERSR